METRKILFVNVPADGHFNPLTSLAMHLKKQGHDVRWYTQELYKARIERMGIPYYPFVNPPQLNQFNFEDYFVERKAKKGQLAKFKFDLEHVFIRRMPEYFEDIQEIYRNFPFDLFIADIFSTVLPLVKEKLKVPAVAVGIVPIMETSGDLPPAGMGLLPAYNFAGRIKQALLRRVSNILVLRNANKLFRAILSEYGVQAPEGNMFDILYRSSSLVLQVGTPGFEYSRSDMGPNIRFIGHLLPHMEKKAGVYELPEKYKHFRKKILVTQGTVEKDPNKIIEPTLDAFRNTDILVIATTGSSQTMALREKYPDANFLIEDFIPFDDVMPVCDAFITNGGYGGVMLGIANQLPMVVAGIHEGKNEVSARVGYFNLGINLKTEKPTPSQIRTAVYNIIHNPAFKTNVSRLAVEFRQFDPLALSEKYITELLAAG